MNKLEGARYTVYGPDLTALTFTWARPPNLLDLTTNGSRDPGPLVPVRGVLTQPLEEHTARTQRSASGLKAVDVSSFSTHIRATMWSGFLKYYHDLLQLCGPMQNGIVMKCDFFFL